MDREGLRRRLEELYRRYDHRFVTPDPLEFVRAQTTDADREVVELRHHADLSFKQMAQLLNEPIGTLLARHHRALRKLRATLEQAMGPSQGEGPSHA